MRAINCETNNLFVIVRPEELKLAQEKFFLRKFGEKITEKNYKIESCIIILYLNENSHIIKQLKNLKKKYGFDEEPALFNDLHNYKLPDLRNLQIEIVTSDSPKVGKTTYIENQIFNKSKEYIPFSLGNIDKLYLSMKTSFLNNYNNEEDGLSIFFELYDNPEENTKDIIKDFLFQFLILKVYDKYDFTSKQNIRIFIEISSDYTIMRMILNF